MHWLHRNQLRVLYLRKISDSFSIKVKREVKMLKENIEKVLEEIRPSLQADGGDVELVSVEDGVVKVRFLGGCSGCPFRAMTLKVGIERYFKEKLPEVKEVISV